jgi:hypothetical protein
MLQLKTVKQFAQESGYSEKAIRTKLDKGVWGTGIKFKAPDGRVLISMEGFERWVQGTEVFQNTANHQSGSTSFILEKDGMKLSKARLPTLT